MFFDTFSALCSKRGVTKNKAALEMGLSNSTVTKWRKTGATPAGDTLSKLSKYFGVSLDFLLGLTPESYLLTTEYQLQEAEKEYERETDAEKRNELAVRIDLLRESLADVRLGAALQEMAQENTEAKKIETLQDLRDSQRVLLEATNGMTQDQIDLMVRLAKTIRGGDADAD